MAGFTFPGPICQTRDWFDTIDADTLARGLPTTPPPIGSILGGAPSATSPTAASPAKCSFLDPRTSGTVEASADAFLTLRKKSGPATVSPARDLPSHTWPDGSTTTALEQDVHIDGHTIKVIRPTVDAAKDKNLPTTQQLAESLRALPPAQRRLVRKVILSPTASPGSTPGQTVAGEGGSGEIVLFPLKSGQTQNDFDNRVTHEAGHNYQETFWRSKADVEDWRSAASADGRSPSPYAATNPGDDFCEFLILYNATKGTACEDTTRKLYPNRWTKLEQYAARP